MARVANTPRTIALQALEYIEKEIHAVNKALQDSEELVKTLTDAGSFTTANITRFKNDKLAESKTHNSNAVAMYRWILDHFSISIPAALDDTGVDSIDVEIRTHEV